MSALFTKRVVKVRNSMSFDSVEFPSLKSFQHSIRAVDLSGFCVGSKLARSQIVVNILNFESVCVLCSNCPLFVRSRNCVLCRFLCI